MTSCWHGWLLMQALWLKEILLEECNTITKPPTIPHFRKAILNVKYSAIPFILPWRAQLHLQYFNNLFCSSTSTFCTSAIWQWNGWEWIDRQANSRTDIVHTMSLNLSLYWTGISASIPARAGTANQSNTAGGSESVCPETPENERRNKFGGKQM